MTTWAVKGGEAGATARPLLEARDEAATRPGRARSVAQADRPGLEAGPGTAAQAARLAASLLETAPAAMGFVPQPQTIAAAARGYATSSAAAKKVSSSTAAKAKSASTSSAAAKRSTPSGDPVAPVLTGTATELAFLRDRSLSVEDKLFMFLALMEKKGNQELEQAMEDYAARRKAAKEAAAKTTAADTQPDAPKAEPSVGGGLLGGLFGGVVDAVQGVVKQVGGPLLASAATAVGLPFLAPAALSLGGALGSDLVGAVADLAGIEHGGAASKAAASASKSTSTARASSTASKSSSSSGSASTSAAPKSDVGDFDEKYEMAKIERLQEKQNAMFSCLSNVLKSMHDTQMVAVNNLR